MTAKPPPLAEPIEISKEWKSRARKIAIVGTLRSYEGHNLYDLREYFTDQSGCMKPSSRGLCLSVQCLPELSRSVRRALEKARALNLLPEEGSER
jgi:hypothetical protein